jgi:hypothetical protein
LKLKLVQPFNSESWSEWVLSQFADDELENGAPTCDGLRRVAEDVLGPIEKVEVIKNDTPNVNNKGNATVVVGVTMNQFYWRPIQGMESLIYTLKIWLMQIG